jgi:antibiotic biosynthesis monooxygenase (ABM) superfamily enzyme
MLYRFADQASLDKWQSSPQRAWWLGSAQGLVGESRVEHRTGIEGWFDEPESRDVQDLRPPAAAPPRWKQAIVIWMAFFPLSLVLGLLLSNVGLDLGIVVRTFVSTLVATPIMTYALLPWMTRAFAWWLKPDPA